jgi:hypothetical protein
VYSGRIETGKGQLGDGKENHTRRIRIMAAAIGEMLCPQETDLLSVRN